MDQNPPPGWNNPQTSEFGPVQQPGPGYGGPPRKQGMSPVLIVVLTVVVMLLIGLVALAAVLVVPRFTENSAVPVTSTVSATATVPEAPAQPTAQPAQPAQPVRPAQGAAPAGAYECMDAGAGSYSAVAVGSSQTSCEFAESVWAEYLVAGGDGGPLVIDAYSPVTGNVYTMSCSGGGVVTCTGGNNAVVYIY